LEAKEETLKLKKKAAWFKRDWTGTAKRNCNKKGEREKTHYRELIEIEQLKYKLLKKFLKNEKENVC